MIKFNELEIIAVIEGKPYKIIIDGNFSYDAGCYKCALHNLPVCKKYACSSSQHDLSYHYEEIPT